MKILRLDLRAFGPFTDASIDLSAGGEGLHVIYGPNEAGKTSTLRAIEQVLFGIPTQSGDAFLHSYQNLRIGATLQNAGGTTLSFVRRKGNANTLLADDGLTPLDDSLLRPFVGTLDRDLFLTMFGLDHARLVQGGREIVHGSGNVGQILFAAGAGLVHLQEMQDRLQKEADGLFARRAQNRPINQHLKALDTARKAMRHSQLPGDQWTEHDQRLREGRASRQQVEEELEELQRDISRLDRIAQTLPVIAQRRQTLAERESLGKVTMLRADFADERRRAVSQLEVAQKSAQSAAEGVERLDRQLQPFRLPEALLALAAEIRELSDPLGSHRKAQRDLPGLDAQRKQLLEDATAILRDFRPGMSLEMVDQLRLTTAQKNALRDLGSRHEALVRGRDQASEEIEDAQRQLDEERQQQAQLEAIRNPSALKIALQLAQRQGDLDNRVAKADAELRRLQQQAAADLKRLPLWTGTLEALEGLAVPAPETIDRHEQELAEAGEKLHAVVDKIRQAQSALADIERQLEQSRLEGEVPTEQDLLEAREVRELGWQLVRQSWEGETPDAERLTEFLAHFPTEKDLAGAYAQAVREADDRADRLRREAGRVAVRASLLSGREALERQLCTLQKEHESAARQQAEAQLEWHEGWQRLGIEPRTPREMRSWLLQHQSLVQQAAAMRLQQASLDQLQHQMQTHRQELLDQLIALGESPDGQAQSFSGMVARCQCAVEHLEAVAAARVQSEKAARLLENRLSAARVRMERSEKELAEWGNHWASAVEPLGLATESTPAEANQVLAQLTELFDRLKQAQSIGERIEAMTQDAASFLAQVAALANQVDPELVSLPPDQAADAMIQRLQKALQEQKQVQTLRQQRERYAADADKARQAMAQHTAALNTLCREAGCKTPEELPEAERASDAARRLDERLAGFNDQLLRLGVGAAMDTIIAEAEAVNADELPGRIDQLRQRIAELESQRKELSETIGAEESTIRAMQTGSEAADAAETIQELLARLETDVQQYARLRLASAVLREGIERYRRKNEGPVLRRASELFRRLTLRRFDRLSADCDDRGDKLLKGVRTGDGAVAIDVSGMSEGTADQLYLALRLASLENYLEGREPIPFVVDDVLISFDNDRAAAALGVLADFSARTQVIFFTHHAHLVEVARQSVAADVLFVHEMA
jgi:uncharacterized protein YhaN